MGVVDNTLPKDERLFWKRDIDTIFSAGQSFIAYPLRIVYLIIDPQPSKPPVSILISVPKRRIKRAVHRNRLKRLIRETYRTRKQALSLLLTTQNKKLSVAFLYVGDEVVSFAVMENAMRKALAILQEKVQ